MKAGLAWLIRLHGLRRARRVAEAYRQLLAPETDSARLVLSDLAQYCRVGRSSFVPGDPYQTAFNEGARDVFLHIAGMSGLAAADFTGLIDEVLDER